MIRLVRRFSRRRNMSSSRIHCCYIVVGTVFRQKHILEQDEFFSVQSSALGLKKKKKILCFSPPWELQTTISSLRTPDPFLLLGDPGFLINLPKNWLSLLLFKSFWSFRLGRNESFITKYLLHDKIHWEVKKTLINTFKLSHYFELGSKITADGDCSHEIKRRLLLGRKLSAKELMLLNCGVGEDSWESLLLQRDQTSPSYRRSVLGVH